MVFRHASDANDMTGCAWRNLVETGTQAISPQDIPPCGFAFSVPAPSAAILRSGWRWAGHEVSCVMRGSASRCGQRQRPHAACWRHRVQGPRQGVRRSRRAGTAGRRDLHLEGDRPAQSCDRASNRCSAMIPPSCSRRTAFPGGTISGFPPRIRRCRIWLFSIRTVACARRYRASGSSAAWFFRRTRSSRPASPQIFLPSATGS